MVATALQYQVLTDATDFIVTHARSEEEKARELPELRTVPHMLAAGWGGVGTVRSEVGYGYDLLRGFDDTYSQVFGGARSIKLGVEPAEKNWVEQVADLLQWDAGTQDFTVSGLALLRVAGAPQRLVDALQQIVLGGADEHALLQAFLQELAESKFGRLLSRKAWRVIAKLSRARPADRALTQRAREVLEWFLIPPAQRPQQPHQPS
jgi:Ca-activated chloride channel family protein